MDVPTQEFEVTKVPEANVPKENFPPEIGRGKYNDSSLMVPQTGLPNLMARESTAVRLVLTVNVTVVVPWTPTHFPAIG